MLGKFSERVMMKYLVGFVLLFCTGSSWAAYSSAQTIEVTMRLTQKEASPLFWLLVRNEDTGTTTPFMLTITDLNQYAYFKVDGDNYSLQKAEIQQGGQSIPLCDIDPDEIISGNSLRLDITGSLTEKKPHLACHESYTPSSSVIDLRGYQDTAGSSSSVAATKTDGKAGATTDGKKKYAGLIRYLHGLSSCKVGNYPVEVNGKTIVYTIKGEVVRHCDVVIRVKGKSAPIRCRFDKRSVDYLTSKEQIASYETGKLSAGSKSRVTEIMNRSCH
jgi:hypothetical protein